MGKPTITRSFRTASRWACRTKDQSRRRCKGSELLKALSVQKGCVEKGLMQTYSLGANHDGKPHCNRAKGEHIDNPPDYPLTRLTRQSKGKQRENNCKLRYIIWILKLVKFASYDNYAVVLRGVISSVSHKNRRVSPTCSGGGSFNVSFFPLLLNLCSHIVKLEVLQEEHTTLLASINKPSTSSEQVRYLFLRFQLSYSSWI